MAQALEYGTCGDCRYFTAGLYCHRYPPTPLFGAHFAQPGDGVPQVEFVFPEVLETDFCGEFTKIVPLPGGPGNSPQVM